jgi:hypothetical protein
VTPRRRVDGLGSAIAVYGQVPDGPTAHFRFVGLDPASAGPSPLFSGPEEIAGRFSGVAATSSALDLAVGAPNSRAAEPS